MASRSITPPPTSSVAEPDSDAEFKENVVRTLTGFEDQFGTIIEQNKTTQALIDEFSNKIRERIESGHLSLAKEISKAINAMLDARFDKLQGRLDEKLDTVGAHFVTETGRLDTRIDTVHNDLVTGIGRLDTRIDTVNDDLAAQIKMVNDNLAAQINTANDNLTAQIGKVTSQIDTVQKDTKASLGAMSLTLEAMDAKLDRLVEADKPVEP